MLRKTIVVISMILIVTFNNTCKKSTDPTLNNQFQIHVDSLILPDAVNLTDTIVCKFWAFVGSDLCYQFSHFETNKDSENIRIKLWGYNTGEKICATAISELRGKEYKFVAEQQGIIRINIMQPIIQF